MAFNKQPAPEQQTNAPKKADVILRTNMDISSKQDEIINQTKLTNSRIDAALELFSRNVQDSNYIAKQNGDIFAQIQQENASLRQELLYLAKQSENIYSRLSDQMDRLFSDMSKIKEETQTLDYDLLAQKVAALIQVSVFGKNELNYDELADKLAVRTPAQVVTETGVVIDYDTLAKKIAEVVADREEISPDYIASKVAEQIVIPATVDASLDEEGLAKKIAEFLPAQSVQPEIDTEELAKKVAEQIVLPESEQTEVTSIDEEALATRIAELLPEKKTEIDEETLARHIAEHMPAMDAAIDEEALAKRISDFMPSVIIDEETLATRLAEHMPAMDAAIDEAALANRIAELLPAVEAGIDEEVLAARVAELMPASEAVVDSEAIAARVAELMPAAETGIDEEALAARITERIPASEAVVDAEVIAARVAELLPVNENKPYDEQMLARRIASYMTVGAVGAAAASSDNVDYDILAERVAEIVAAKEVLSPDYIASKVVEQIVLPQPEPVSVEIDEDKLASLVAEKVAIPAVELDEARIADLVAEKVAVPAVEIDENVLAEKVAEKVALPQIDTPSVDFDEERLANLVAEKVAVPAVELNEEAIAELVAQKIDLSGLKEAIAVASAETAMSATAGIDEEELADAIALKVGAIRPEDYEIIVDDAGCTTLSKEIAEGLDYDVICETVSERLREAIDLANAEEPDYEEMAQRISEKITVAGVNEDVIADKAAAVLSNYLPDFDEIVDKVTSNVMEALATQPVVDNETICNAITEKLMSSTEDHDYDIVIDEDGIAKITEMISDGISKDTEKYFERADERLAKLEESVAAKHAVTETVVSESGVAVCRADELIQRYEEQYGKVDELLAKTDESVGKVDALLTQYGKVDELIAKSDEALTKEDEHYEKVEEHIAKSYERYDLTSEKLSKSEERIEKIEGDVAEIKAMLAAGAVMVGASEISTGYNDYEETLPLVKVSDIVEPKREEEDEEEDDSQDDIEEPADGDGVDFENMMRYNRSFISRIIQGTDDQKKYYGEVKHALLSYRKVNSNVAWGAERFNKGRETIARFKIRGKTLCVYLALDPADYKTSVYHHTDVSDNKSMHGTPMMLKVKSPLGVKKVIRLIDEMLAVRGGEKRKVAERDYAAMYPYETIEQLIEDGLVKDVSKSK